MGVGGGGRWACVVWQLIRDGVAWHRPPPRLSTAPDLCAVCAHRARAPRLYTVLSAQWFDHRASTFVELGPREAEAGHRGANYIY